MLGNQNRSLVSIFIRQQHDERKKIQRLLKENLDTFLSIGNHAPKERTRPPLLCFAYRKETECVCNSIVNCLYIMYSRNAAWRPRILEAYVVWCEYCFKVTIIHFCIHELAHRSLWFPFGHQMMLRHHQPFILWRPDLTWWWWWCLG